MGEENRRWKTALSLMIVALIVWAVLGSAGGSDAKDARTPTEGETSGDQSEIFQATQRALGYAETIDAAQAESPAPTSGWRYTAEKDEMRGTTRKVAYIDSPQRLEFQFPYAGGSTVTLYISKRGAAKPVIGLKVDKGQFICSITGDTAIQVKFGDRPVEPFGCLVASDGSSNVIFMSHPELFLVRMRKTKALIIEAPFYREGVRQIRFETAGLDWK